MTTLPALVSRLLFDDAACCGPYSLVYAPCESGVPIGTSGQADYATYTLYHRATYVTRWRVKTYTRLEAVRWQVVSGLAWVRGEWAFEEGGGFAFVAEDETPVQLELWAA